MQIIEDTKVKLDEYERKGLAETYFLMRKISREATDRDLYVAAKSVLIFLELFENEHLED